MYKVLDSNDNGYPLFQVFDDGEGNESFDLFYAEFKALMSKHRVHMVVENCGISGLKEESPNEAHICFTQYAGEGKYDLDDIGFIAEATDMWPEDAECLWVEEYDCEEDTESTTA